MIDATRLSDGLTVAIKQVKAGSEEISINKLLSTEERLKDPQNHAVPLLDSFTDDKDSNVAFLVMPLLRNFDDPPFSAVQEVIDFVRQTLQVGPCLYLASLSFVERTCKFAGLGVHPPSGCCSSVCFTLSRTAQSHDLNLSIPVIVPTGTL